MKTYYYKKFRIFKIVRGTGQVDIGHNYCKFRRYHFLTTILYSPLLSLFLVKLYDVIVNTVLVGCRQGLNIIIYKPWVVDFLK